MAAPWHSLAEDPRGFLHSSGSSSSRVALLYQVVNLNPSALNPITPLIPEPSTQGPSGRLAMPWLHQDAKTN